MTDSLENSSRYQIQGQDSGGNSIVYKALDTQLNMLVAIKSPLPAVANNEAKLQKFIEEAQMLARIKHDNVVSALHFYEAGEIDKNCLLVTQWMDSSLAELLEGEVLAPASAMQILRKICAGITAIHKEGIIHRDLKPENIFVSSDASDVRIGDLGIASDVGVEQTTLTITPKYTAPENYHQDKVVGRQSDIYSLGMIAYEMLLGKNAFQNEFDAIYSVESEKVRSNRWTHWHMNTAVNARPLSLVRPDIPQELSDIVQKMMVKETSERYLDISEVLSDLQGTMGEATGYVAPLNLDDLDEDKPSSRWGWFGTPIGITVSTLVMLGIIAGILLFPSDSGIPREEVDSGFEYINGLRDEAINAGADTAIVPFAEAEALYSTAQSQYESEVFALSLENLVASEPFYKEAYKLAWMRRLDAQAGQIAQAETKVLEVKIVEVDSGLVSSRALVEKAVGAGKNEEFEQALEFYQQAVTGFETAVTTAPRRFEFGSTPSEIKESLKLCSQFQAGCLPGWYEDELLREEVLKPFTMDTFEVTKEQFSKFASETNFVTEAARQGFSHKVVGLGVVVTRGVSWDKPNDREPLSAQAPVSHLSAEDAEAYCEWAGKRVPTEAEWEYAARGTDRRTYAWGNEWKDDIGYWSQPGSTLLDVGSYPESATPEGLHDMTGSVWEWTGSENGPVAKGGSRFDFNPANLRAAVRRSEQSGYTSEDIGIRCVKDSDRWLSAF